jgi:hypothetical protein
MARQSSRDMASAYACIESSANFLRIETRISFRGEVSRHGKIKSQTWARRHHNSCYQFSSRHVVFFLEVSFFFLLCSKLWVLHHFAYTLIMDAVSGPSAPSQKSEEQLAKVRERRRGQRQNRRERAKNEQASVDADKEY